jgi:hypothetical protein
MLCFVLPRGFYVILGPNTNPCSENVLHGRCLDSFLPNPPMKSPRCNPEQFCHPNCSVGLFGHSGVPLHHLSSEKRNPEGRDCANLGHCKEYPRMFASERRRGLTANEWPSLASRSHRMRNCGTHRYIGERNGNPQGRDSRISGQTR